MADQEPPKKKKRVSFAPDTAFNSSDSDDDFDMRLSRHSAGAEDDGASNYALPGIPPPGVVAAAQYSASGPNSTLPSRVGSPFPTTATTTADEILREYPAGVEVEIASSPLHSSDQPTPISTSPPLQKSHSAFFSEHLLVSPNAAVTEVPSSSEPLSASSTKKRVHADIDAVSDSLSEDDMSVNEGMEAEQNARIIKTPARRSWARSLEALQTEALVASVRKEEERLYFRGRERKSWTMTKRNAHSGVKNTYTEDGNAAGQGAEGDDSAGDDTSSEYEDQSDSESENEEE